MTRSTSRPRIEIVKARVARKLGADLAYLRREGVPRDGDRAQMFGADRDRIDAGSRAVRYDRHHFLLIVSPNDALEMVDLRSFTRDLMAQTERDLGTKLDWIAVDHWNKERLHIDITVRGVRDDG